MVIDDVLSAEEQKTVEELLIYAEHFPWYYYDHTSYKNWKWKENTGRYQFRDNERESPQFVHSFLTEDGIISKFWKIFEPKIFSILDHFNLPDCNIERCKANFMYQDVSWKEGFHNPLHSDSTNENTVSVIYYVNNSDGDTFIYENGIDSTPTRVSPKRGRAIIFPSTLPHASSPPVENDTRVIINTVLEFK